MKSEFMSAMLAALTPIITDEEKQEIRRVMVERLARRKHKGGS